MGIIGCSEENQQPAELTTEEILIGKWKIISLDLFDYGYTNTIVEFRKPNSCIVTDKFTATPRNYRWTLTKDDNKISIVNMDDELQFSITIVNIEERVIKGTFVNSQLTDVQIVLTKEK